MTDKLPTGETPSPSRGSKLSTNSNSRNEGDDAQWLLLPNNLEINSQSKPSKKQKNKESLKHFPQESLSVSVNMTDGFANECSSLQNYPRAKCNSWLKDQLVESKLHECDQKPKNKVHGVEEAFGDSDFQRFSLFGSTNDVPEQHGENQRPSSRRSLAENENINPYSDVPKTTPEVPCETCAEGISKLQEDLKQVQQRQRTQELIHESIPFIRDCTPSPSSIQMDMTYSINSTLKEDHFTQCMDMIGELEKFTGKTMSVKLRDRLLSYMDEESGKKLTTTQESLDTCDSHAQHSNIRSLDTYDSHAQHSNVRSLDTYDSHAQQSNIHSTQRSPNIGSLDTYDSHGQQSNIRSIQRSPNIGSLDTYDSHGQQSNICSTQRSPHIGSLDTYDSHGQQSNIRSLDTYDSHAQPSKIRSLDTYDSHGQQSNIRSLDTYDSHAPQSNIRSLWTVEQEELHQRSSKDEKQVQKQLNKRIKSLQRSSNTKNDSASISSDECDVSNADGQASGCQCERKKCNKTLEIHERNRRHDRMLKELYSLKDAAEKASSGREGSCPYLPSSESPQPQAKNKRSDSQCCDLQDFLQDIGEKYILDILSDEGFLEESSIVQPRNSSTIQLRNSSTLQTRNSSTLQSRNSLTNEASGTPGPRIDNRNVQTGSYIKRDNVKKEINSGFPARRHYEAEGRANEDPDIPNVPAATQPTVSSKLPRQPGKQGKIRKLLNRRVKLEEQVKLIDEVLTSVTTAKDSGSSIPDEHLRLLSDLENEKIHESDRDVSSSSEEECFEPLAIENSKDNLVTNPKEIFAEATGVALHQSSSKNSSVREEFIGMLDGMSYRHDSEKNGKANLVDLFHNLGESCNVADGDFPNVPAENMVTHPKVPAALHLNENHDNHENPPIVAGMENGQANSYQNLMQQLLQVYQNLSVQRKKDLVRSSGEGDYVSNRNHISNLPPASEQVQSASPLQFCGHPENLLLTQQNIATMESQNQGKNLRTEKSDKRENINNLSGKMGKLKIQNAAQASFGSVSGCSRDNMDSASVRSSELNLIHSCDGERKTILDILKQSKKKQKEYDRNQICSNSSIESEPLDGSNSALAQNTCAATWGGSSTLENFVDENGILSSIVPEDNASGGSNYHDTTKAKKISKSGPFGGARSRNSNEQPKTNQAPSKDSSKDYQQHTSSNFIQQIKKKLDQLNALCQRELQSETPQASSNMFSTANQNWMNACPPPQALPDVVHPYNQQLLLCLSQCYHTLYMQQLEIQHLNRCLRHNADAETLRVNNLGSQSENTGGIPLRPWCITNANPTIPSNMYSGEHLSPRSAYLPVSGTRPVQAVINPANQETRVSQETLNNQVPPRTRANNFWDNFRSYSRQNLLSTSNTVKRNENVSFPVAPQIRQVHPMVLNENLVPEQEMVNSYPSMPSDYISFRSSLNENRPLQNAEGAVHNQDKNSDSHDHTLQTKKPNSSSPLLGRGRGSQFRKGSSNNFSGDRNARSARFNSLSNELSVSSIPNESSVNLIQLHQNQEESKVENFSYICPSSTSEIAASSSIPELSNHVEGEHQSDFLLGLYSEVRALKDVQRQEALNIIRSIALREKQGDGETSQSKIKIDNTSSFKPETSINVVPDQDVNNLLGEPCASGGAADDNEIDSEKLPNRLSSESSVLWVNQNLPTAAIPPLSKLAPSKSTSTGAVRKKTKFQATCSWESPSNPQVSPANNQDSRTSLGDDYVASPLQSLRGNDDVPAAIVDNIIVDLQFSLPFNQMREDSSFGFWSSINAYILTRIRAYISVPLPHKSLASLRQVLDNVLTRFSGMKFCDCEAEFLKYISHLLYDSVTCFVSTGRFTPSSPFTSNWDGVISPVQEPQDLRMKMPADTLDKTSELSINMPVDEVFLPSFQPVMQQNVLSTSGIDDANIDSTQHFGIPTEEDIPHEWDPEAEVEPEVETGTEADLAEADQSPGQQGTISSTTYAGDTWPADQSADHHNEPLPSDEIVAASDDALEVGGAHASPDSSGGDVQEDDDSSELDSSHRRVKKLLKETV